MIEFMPLTEGEVENPSDVITVANWGILAESDSRFIIVDHLPRGFLVFLQTFLDSDTVLFISFKENQAIISK